MNIMSKTDLTKAREMVRLFSRRFQMLFLDLNCSITDLEILTRMLVSNLDNSQFTNLKKYVVFILQDERKVKDVLDYSYDKDEIKFPIDDDLNTYYDKVYNKFKKFKNSSYYPYMAYAGALTGIKELDDYTNISMNLCLCLFTEDQLKKDKEKNDKKILELLEKTNSINKEKAKKYSDSTLLSNTAVQSATVATQIASLGSFSK